MTIEEAIQSGHDLDVYIDSEMSDEESHSLDDLWQSIYDIVQLACGGIVEEDPQEVSKAIDWLKEVQPLTKVYQDLDIPFTI